MEKLSEEKGSASIRRVSSEAGESLEGISGVQESEDAKPLSEAVVAWVCQRPRDLQKPSESKEATAG
jgi:hypothetical protein